MAQVVRDPPSSYMVYNETRPSIVCMLEVFAKDKGRKLLNFKIVMNIYLSKEVQIKTITGKL